MDSLQVLSATVNYPQPFNFPNSAICPGLSIRKTAYSSRNPLPLPFYSSLSFSERGRRYFGLSLNSSKPKPGFKHSIQSLVFTLFLLLFKAYSLVLNQIPTYSFTIFFLLTFYYMSYMRLSEPYYFK